MEKFGNGNLKTIKMKLNHINLQVTDVAKAVLFFETYFNFKCIAVKGDNIIAVLKGIDDFELVLMQAPKNKQENIYYPDDFHIGFKQINKQAVDEIYHKLKINGIAGGREPGKIRDGYGFYFHYDAIMIEVGTG